MATIGDVKAVGTRVEEFIRENSDSAIDLPDKPGEAHMFMSGINLSLYARNEQAIGLLKKLGKKVCDDNAVNWGPEANELPDEAALSKDAEGIYQELLGLITPL